MPRVRADNDARYALRTSFVDENGDVLEAPIVIGGAVVETDPVFTASPAGGISSTDITNWNTAHGWGNHASAGYLTSDFNVAVSASNTDPNTDTSAYFLTNHANAPFGSVYAYIQNHWWSSNGGNVAQHATSYNASTTRFAVRNRYSGAWTPWVEFGASPVQSGSGGGQYGSVYIDGGAVGGHEGYSIGGRAVFMHDNASRTGIYNDVHNHWLFYADHNAASHLCHAGAVKGYTYSSGWRVTGNLLASSDVYAYYSDERLKDVVGRIEKPLESIGAIETFYYTHNDKARELGYEGSERQVGVSAQSVQAVLPEVIGRAPIDDDGEGGSVTGEDYITVQYHRIVPLLIEGIKELTKRIEELEEERDGNPS